MPVHSNLLKLKNELEVQERRRYTGKDIAQATGLNRHTVNDLLNDTSKAIYYETMDALVQFFRARGMAIEYGDLFYERSE